MVIAKWYLKGVVPSKGETSIATKVKLRNDPSGFYTIEEAYTVEEKLVKELVEKEPKEKKEDDEDEEDEEPEYREVKKLVKKNDLVITMESASLSDDEIAALFEKENSMVVEDKLVADTEDKKNALEEYIYELRGKLDDQYKDFATEAKYVAKYEELASLGNLIRGRYLANEEEKKQALRQKQEQAQAAAMAEKLAAARKGGEPEKKETKESDDADGDIKMD